MTVTMLDAEAVLALVRERARQWRDGQMASLRSKFDAMAEKNGACASAFETLAGELEEMKVEVEL